MNTTDKKTIQRKRRHARVRGKIRGTAKRPRLAVFRSNKYIYAQLIDDVKAETLVSLGGKEMKGSSVERAMAVGEGIAENAKKKGIQKVVFDRGGFLYAGQVKALAEAARKGGLEF
jgi:large subunit ribosomal protein L18